VSKAKNINSNQKSWLCLENKKPEKNSWKEGGGKCEWDESSTKKREIDVLWRREKVYGDGIKPSKD